jgi:KilA-N domain
MVKDQRIQVQSVEVRVKSIDDDDFICLTDIAKSKNPDHPDDLIRNWLRNRNTLELIGIWEKLHNPSFNPVEFDGIRNQAGLNSFTLTPKQWTSATNAVGIQSRAGRHGGTYAHKDIAFEFASWVSVEFKLYLIKEFQRLKNDEQRQLGWDIKRHLTKINYRIHTDAVKNNLIPTELSPPQISMVYASEADLLNMALFGTTAQQWRSDHPDDQGNMRDYANVAQLVCLANLETLNAHLIKQGLPSAERVTLLNTTAIEQMRLLTIDTGVRKLERGEA